MRELLHRWGEFSSRFTGFVQLITRMSLGFMFFQAGLGKLQNLSRVIGFFSTLHIPIPHVLVPFVASTEFVGGILLMLGLATRFITIPLGIIMIVALLTAHLEDITDMSSLLGLSAYLYLLLLAWLLTNGAGKVSLDYWIKKACQRK